MSDSAARLSEGETKNIGLRIKRIYDLPSEEDGHRVLVDRLWPRGITRERAQLDDWLIELSPTPSLRRWFSHAPDRFDYFRERYLAQLDDGQGNRERADALLRLSEEKRVTLLYAARDTAHNHAVVLKEWLLGQNQSSE
ncbi:hypothetical protein B9G55_05695 [Saccharibacillus sp. O16]|nr:hypothetical protein B9G55_05695 [Saccharibacillus sp. O16]